MTPSDRVSVSPSTGEPVAPGAGEFTVSTAIRVQRMWRLHGDLDVDLFGAAIIADLVDRMEQLEAEVRRIRKEPG